MAANPDGIVISAIQTSPLPKTSKMPLMPAIFLSGGSRLGSPLIFPIKNISNAAKKNRTEAINNGGNEMTAYLIAKYVDPQTIYTLRKFKTTLS